YQQYKSVEVDTHPQPFPNKGREKQAFTLAEVLITLAIIGVVAAMTIPTLVSNYQEKVTVTKVKKIYTTLANAYQLYINDNGEPGDFNYDEEGAVKSYKIFEPYLKIAKDCGTLSGDGCMYTSLYLLKNGDNAAYYADSNLYYKILLADGASLWVRGHAINTTMPETNSYLSILYDVNGTAGPNKWGYDLFDFRAYVNKGILPVGVVENDYSFEEYCAPQNSKGYGCTAWVIHKGNMDYLKCDDLTWADSRCSD
ncbi:type II secretion system protein, partial [bacterium]|nr:type II secretion system protein [bacterium]